MRSKGLIRILEAIIASVIILTAMTFFFTSQFRPQVEESVLFIQGYDALGVLNQQGLLEQYVKNNDAAGMTDQLATMLPATTGFSVEVVGIANPDIYIACNCTDAETNELRTMLEPSVFTYRGRAIEIFVDSTPLNPIRSGTNVLVLRDYANLSAEWSPVSAFLDGGGTVFLFTDLSEPEVADPILNRTFGLQWSDQPLQHPERFANITNPASASTQIYRYFDNLTPVYYNDVTRGEFSDFFTPPVFYIAADGESVISDQYRSVATMNGQELKPGNSFVKGKTNLGVTGRGRFVWFSSYQRLDPDKNQTKQMDGLFKAAVLWASGERFSLDAAPKTRADQRLQVRYLVAGSDTFEPFEIVLTIWRIFF